MDEKLLLKAVVLAGEIMLSSGAEVSRVENTMQFMLRRSNCEVTEAVVLATGLFVTMADPGGEPMTFSKRIPARSTNINRICRVNEVSRQFCHMELTVEEAYEELKRIQKEILYKPWMKLAGIIGISVSFIFIYGGNFLDLSTSVLVGICMAAADRFTKILRLNDFSTTAFCGFVVAFSAMLIQELCPFKVSGDVMIMSAIMYLVPGSPLPLRPGIPLTETMPPDLPGCWNVSLWPWPWLWAWALECLLPDIMGRNAMMILQILSAFSAVLVFTMILEIPKKYML